MPSPPDAGPVSVPPALAGPLLRVLVRALVREAREDGGQVPAGIADFLRALDAAARRPVADDGHDHEPLDMIGCVTGWASVAQLAEHTGHPPRTLCRWAAGGRVRAVRVGRTWLIDPESMKGRHDAAFPVDRHTGP